MAQIKQQSWQKSLRFTPDNDDYNVVRAMQGGIPPLLRISICRDAERVALRVIGELVKN